jgi:glycosyltransferase involved in cell wall biosynthesis/SAM-dependent methyltransferase
MTANREDNNGFVPLPENAPDGKRQSSGSDDSASFYATFEDRFRGPREDIARRQSVYIPLLEKAEILRSDAPILDIGCGRGEWLELLGQHGFIAKGVDLNEKFVYDCRQRGVDVVYAEACEFLRSQPAEAYAAITSFHLVEHLPFAQLRELITEIHRVLRPGGIIILETPNPENIVVGASTFYFDPSHLAPIPPGLLQFVTEQAGFLKPSIARLNAACTGVPLAYLPREAPHSLQVNALIHLLNQGFYGAPDYSIIAQKSGGSVSVIDSEELKSLCEPVFMDITQFRQLEATAKYQKAESQIEMILAGPSWRVTAPLRAMSRAVKSICRQQHAAHEDAVRMQRSGTIPDSGEHRDLHRHSKRVPMDIVQFSQLEAETKAWEAESQLCALLASTSWRITAPLRVTKQAIKQFKDMIWPRLAAMTILPRRMARRALLSALAYVLFKPKYKAMVKRIIALFPMLEVRLRMFSKANRRQAVALSAIKRSLPLTPSAAPLFGKSLPTRPNNHSSSSSPPIFPLKTGYRFIYYYVDHTILCPVNTGMQRVTRRLGRALLEQGEQVRFVKWDVHHQELVLLNREELAYFAQWHGPSLSEEELENYPLPHVQPPSVSKYTPQEGHWLVVPEVTHITYHPHPVTLDVIMAAKRLGLKTAFIYYDAIPLRRPELAAMAPNHETYMQQLLLAELVVPISNWSARDLLSFFHTHEGATLIPTPKVAAIALPGESQLARRVAVPASSGEAGKVILSVGSIEPRKNQVALVQAFETFCADHPENDWQLALVGNLHPDVKHVISLAVKRNSRIKCLEHIPDSELDALYRSCAFTVFASVEEGFGLPILESLWYAKPCICADFGAMAEVADGGGCLTVNVRKTEELVRAITRMIFEPGLLDRLSREAASRPMSTWTDYAKRLIGHIDHESDPIHQLGVIYYWVDHTCTYPSNSGIQRVVRGLARALLEMGLRLIPVKWDRATSHLYAPTAEELLHLAQWNGPQPSAWTPWRDPLCSSMNDWLLIPELVSDPAGPDGKAIKQYASSQGLRGAWIFYDAIPWKMRDIYPPGVSNAHRHYMEGLNEFEQVFAISEFSRMDLAHFLSSTLMRTPDLDQRILACVLPGEFLEAARITEIKAESNEIKKILCVCTIEHRKNHLGLLEAFAKVVGQTEKPLELWLVGGCPFPDLADQVNHCITPVPGIHWERNADDTRLHELYAECDFTVYPSIEEGFGLPILESLWNARPCICRGAGAMAEVAYGGGCLTVETTDSEALAQAILRLVEDDGLRLRLAREATTRSFKTWRDYAHEIAIHMATERHIPLPQLLPETISASEFYGQFVNVRPRPLLSICITTYNRAEWLALSLKNLAQLIPNPLPEIEIVVCDNTSTDHTPDIVKPYLQRTDFRYYRNVENVGMLGNLRITAHHAKGQYVWILGDDDLIKPGGIERVLQVIQTHPGTALIYLNYAYTRQDDAKAVFDLGQFLSESTPVAVPGPDIVGPVHRISTESENFFTAIYCLVFRRDHALRAYSQNTEGRPFSTMLTCIPTTYHVLNFMMNEPGYWVGEPMVVVNLNVSWMKYASIWILERLPEAHDLAEKMGASPQGIDRCRINHFPHVVHWFREIFENDQEANIDYFSAQRLIDRMKHLDEFWAIVEILKEIYNRAHSHGRPGAEMPASHVFAAFENQK